MPVVVASRLPFSDSPAHTRIQEHHSLRTSSLLTDKKGAGNPGALLMSFES